MDTSHICQSCSQFTRTSLPHSELVQLSEVNSQQIYRCGNCWSFWLVDDQKIEFLDQWDDERKRTA